MSRHHWISEVHAIEDLTHVLNEITATELGFEVFSIFPVGATHVCVVSVKRAVAAEVLPKKKEKK